MREERENGEQTGRTGRVKGEREKRGRMPLFVNQSPVSERENFQNPQREESDKRGVRRDCGGRPNGGGGYLQDLQRITQFLWPVVLGSPRIASSY